MKNIIKTTFTLIATCFILFQCQEKKEIMVSYLPAKDSIIQPKDSIKSDVVENQDVATIKKWYQEVKQLADDKTLKNCIEASKNEFYKFPDAEENEKLTFVQKAKKCIVNKEYTIYKGYFKGYEWLQNFTFYEKNGKLFFVIYESAAESCGDESRIYYDENLNPIQVLTKTNDCSGNEVGENKTINNQQEIADINKIVEERFTEIKSMLNKS